MSNKICGIFAASMSGAILFNMISQIIRKKSGKQRITLVGPLLDLIV